ncbi:uncharacterized protein PV07_11066 [Cladophialophora immunda]|uniref:CCHC-type domain-containing protein n=2 Tax=Cladophialophora immunda TaxID=569365 RepID=A0A0D2CGV9_9EURO|nr:uncharacterized protein PV07_11066 [Cladophialophora immunda]KIW22804.1 hypothetical protein PV07_11066 [Cladophialophora immunda]
MARLTSSDDESESRTAAVGLKSEARQKGQVNSATSPTIDSSISPQSPTMGNTPSQTTAGVPSQGGPEDVTSSTSDAAGIMASAPAGLGNNRLATGFRTAPPRPAASDESQPGICERDGPLNPSILSGDSVDDAIEISDNEQEESDDGGMVINIDRTQHHHFSDDMILDHDEREGGDTEEEEQDEEEEEEEGETHSEAEGDTESEASTTETTQPLSSTERDAHDQLQGDLERFSGTVTRELPTHSTAADAPIRSGPLLVDLSPDELELQLKYAFFHVSLKNIDLSQPAVCLSCLQSGHAERDCPEMTCIHCSASHSSRLCPQLQRCSKCRDRGHSAESCPAGLKVTTIPCDICGTSNHVEQACPQRFLPSYGTSDTGPTKLWISCCICASKSHLVGDCPRANQAAAARWSLRSFAPDQITNLSLASGMKQREREVANRGLRPEGLKIRGRAALHSARSPSGRQPVDSSDSDEQFLGPRVRTRSMAKRGSLTFATQPPTERSSTTQMPKKAVLLAFLKAINQQRKSSGKGRIDLMYAKNGYISFVDNSDGQNSRVITGNAKQIEVIQKWSRSRRPGEAYLV